MCLHIFAYIFFIAQYYCLKYQISIQICKLGNASKANEVCPDMLMWKCLLAMLILTLVILMLIQCYLI